MNPEEQVVTGEAAAAPVAETVVAETAQVDVAPAADAGEKAATEAVSSEPFPEAPVAAEVSEPVQAEAAAPAPAVTVASETPAENAASEAKSEDAAPAEQPVTGEAAAEKADAPAATTEMTIVKQGYLTKQGGSVKSIKRRWFTLQKGGTETPRLRYYEDVNVKGMAPLSVVSLLGARAWKTRADRIDLDVSGRTYFLQAPSDSDCEEWFRAFEETIPVLEQSQFEKDHPIKVEMEGFLHKSGGTIKTWKKRWFVLRGSKLVYYKDDSLAEPLDSVELLSVADVVRGKVSGKPAEVSFELVTHKRTYQFTTETAAEADHWAGLLTTAVATARQIATDRVVAARERGWELGPALSDSEGEEPASPAATTTKPRGRWSLFGSSDK